MVKVINPLLSGRASGQFAKRVIYDRRGYVRSFFEPANPRSALQVERRERFHDIQVLLGWMKQETRQGVRVVIGDRWHTAIIGWLLASGYATWDGLEQEFHGFSDIDQADWLAVAPSIETTNEPGMVFFMVARAVEARAADVVGPVDAESSSNVADQYYRDSSAGYILAENGSIIELESGDGFMIGEA